jgi:coproporphyrinogen III oxidase-like Fe-S oxidoreductase
LIPHSDVGDAECCGCIVPRYHGSEADLVCNECGLFFKTVPVAEVADRLAELALAIEICSAICPYCDMHQIFTGFSSMIAFTCRHCGEGVAVREVT